MADSLKEEFNYYIEHQDDLVKKYDGKFIVIKDLAVVVVSDDELKAIEEASQKYDLGTFLVQKCEPGEDNYSQTFHSRVAFV